VTEFLDKEKRPFTAAKEWYSLADRSRRDPQEVGRYFKREKHTFAVYHECRVQKPPKLRVGRFFRSEFRRRLSTSQKPPVTASLGHVPIETVRTFIELLELPGRWNSYNAKQIRKENVNAAVNLLGRLMCPGTPAPIVVPTVRGGVQLEWHLKGVDLEIAIDSPEDITFFAEDAQSNEEPEQDLNESTIRQWIGRISK